MVKLKPQFRVNIVSKKTWGGRIIKSFIMGGRRVEYHATKGWRSYRV